MSGDNGSGAGIRFFQDEPKPVYLGKDNRVDHIELTQEQQNIVDVIDKKLNGLVRKINLCRDDCIIPKDARSSVDHLFGTIKEIGRESAPGGSHAQGINDGRDQHKAVKSILRTATMAKDIVLKVVLVSVVVGAIGWLVYGFKAGVNG